MPKVSVIIPVYGVENYIERCARSLFEQTLDDIEYLFIDDCTYDRSVEVLKQVIEEYPARKEQVIIHRMECNSGQAVVRKWGMQNAKGNYVIHCDSDDWVDNDMYRCMYEKAIEKDADIVVSDYYISDGVGNNKIRIGSSGENVNAFIEGVISRKFSWALWNKMVKRGVYAESFIYPSGDMGEDTIICLQMLLNSKIMVYVNTPLYYYFENSNSITNKYSREAIIRRFEQSVANGSVFLKICKERNLYEKYQNEIEIILLGKKNLIRPLVGEKNYYLLWKNTFPEINYSILSNKKIGLKDKSIHILILLGLYRHGL